MGLLTQHYGALRLWRCRFSCSPSRSLRGLQAGPAALAVVLSIGFFDYFFTEPLYTFYVSRSEIPYLIVFVAFASLVAWFSAVRRRVERDLSQARDRLQAEVKERSEQASLLDLTP